ncbi:MAG: YhbY family RNA-binding protein [Bacilli bacterium]|nr:YhbY family RNA-binding protein [Bacilli bacterium]
MILTPKQRAKLKAMANTIHDRYQFGKGEVDDAFVELIDKALEAKELIKVGLLQNAEISAEELANELVKKLDCGLVQNIGRVVILYRPSKKHPTIEL